MLIITKCFTIRLGLVCSFQLSGRLGASTWWFALKTNSLVTTIITQGTSTLLKSLSCTSLAPSLVKERIYTYNDVDEVRLYSSYILISTGTGFIRSRHRSIGVIAVTWCLPAFVFVNIYASCLTSYMSLTFQKPNIGSFQDLAKNPHYQVITLKNSFPENAFLVLLIIQPTVQITFSLMISNRILNRRRWKKSEIKSDIAVINADRRTL